MFLLLALLTFIPFTSASQLLNAQRRLLPLKPIQLKAIQPHPALVHRRLAALSTQQRLALLLKRRGYAALTYTNLRKALARQQLAAGARQLQLPLIQAQIRRAYIQRAKTLGQAQGQGRRAIPLAPSLPISNAAAGGAPQVQLLKRALAVEAAGASGKLLRALRREQSLLRVPAIGNRTQVGLESRQLRRLSWEAAAKAAKKSLGVYHLLPVKLVEATHEGHLGHLWNIKVIFGESACRKDEFDYYDFGRIRECGIAEGARYSLCRFRAWQRDWIQEKKFQQMLSLLDCRPSSAQEAADLKDVIPDINF